MSESPDKPVAASDVPNKNAEKPADPKAPPADASKLENVDLDDIELVEIKAFA